MSRFNTHTHTYIIRPEDKHLTLKYHYPNEIFKFVQRDDSEKLSEVFSGMQQEPGRPHQVPRQDQVPQPPRTGEQGAACRQPGLSVLSRVPYGNHKTEGVETMPAASCVQITLARLRKHVSASIKSNNGPLQASTSVRRRSSLATHSSHTPTRKLTSSTSKASRAY